MSSNIRAALALIGGILLTQIIWFGSNSPIDYFEVYVSSWPTIRDFVYISTTALIYIATLGGIIIIIGGIFFDENLTVLRWGRVIGILGLSLTIDMVWDVIEIISLQDRIIVVMAWIGLIMSLGATIRTNEEKSNHADEIQSEDL